MQTIATSTSSRQSTWGGEALVVERSRGTAHPTVPTTRERVARSLPLDASVLADRRARLAF